MKLKRKKQLETFVIIEQFLLNQILKFKTMKISFSKLYNSISKLPNICQHISPVRKKSLRTIVDVSFVFASYKNESERSFRANSNVKNVRDEKFYNRKRMFF